SIQSLAAIIVGLVGFVLFLALRAPDGAVSTVIIPVVLTWSSAILIEMLHSGLRANIAFIERLKTLPAPPAAIIAGELLPSICFLTAAQTIVVGLATALGAMPPVFAAAIVAAAFVVNVFVVAID